MKGRTELTEAVRDFLNTAYECQETGESQTTNHIEYTPQEFIRRVTIYKAKHEDETDFILTFEVDRPAKDSERYLPFMDLLARLEPGFVGGLYRKRLEKSFSPVLKGPWMPWVMECGGEIPGDLVLEGSEMPLFQSEKGKGKQKKSPKQLAIERMCQLAAKLWKENPNMTITAMYKLKEMKKLLRKPDKTIYSEKFLWKHIKKLNPNPGSGRKPDKA